MVQFFVGVSYADFCSHKLDQMRAARPTLGDEQMIDVELDRKTVFLQMRDTVNTVSWSGDGDYMRKNAIDGNISRSRHASTIDESSTSG